MKNNAKIRIIIWSIVVILLMTVLINGFPINQKSYISSRVSVFSGFGPFRFNSREANIKETNEYTSKIEDIDSINFDLTIDEVTLKKSNESDLKIIENCNYELDKDEKLNISKEDNCIVIKREERSILPKMKSIYRTLEIYVPKDYDKTLVINNKAGDVVIESDFNLEKLEINQSAGDLCIDSNIVCNEFISNIKTGDIDIKNIDTTKYYIEANVGDIEINKLIGFGDIKANVGNIECNIEDVKGDVYIESDTGDVDIFINKGVSFNLNAKYSIGEFDSNLKFENYKHKEKSIKGSIGTNPSNSIDINCNIGDLQINRK